MSCILEAMVSTGAALPQLKTFTESRFDEAEREFGRLLVLEVTVSSAVTDSRDSCGDLEACLQIAYLAWDAVQKDQYVFLFAGCSETN